MKIKINININKTLEYLIVINLILLSGTIYSVVFFNVLYFYSVLVLLMYQIRKRFLCRRELIIFFVFVCVSLLILLGNRIFSLTETSIEYVTFFLRLFISALSVCFLASNKGKIITMIIDAFYGIGIVSIIGWLLSLVISWPAITLNSGVTYNNVFFLHFYAWSENIGAVPIPRNCGIFWEPGVLAVYMNLLLLMYLFQICNIKRALLSSFAILTTFSTTGILLSAILWFYFIKKSLIITRKKKVVISLCMIIPLFILGYFSLSSKVNQSEVVSSYGLRTLDLYTGVMVTKDHLWLGVGLDKNLLLDNIYMNLPFEFGQFESMLDRGNSNSIAQLFMMFGLPVSFLVLYLMYYQEIVYNKKLAFFVIFVSLCTEPLLYSPFFLSILYLGYRNRIYHRFYSYEFINK